MPELKALGLSENWLQTLPASLGQCAAFRKFNMSHNSGLTHLPDDLSGLQSLEVLNLMCNSLSTLPESVGQLQALKQLYLYWNKLESLPASIGQLEKFEVLQLCKNHLHSLPESLQALSLLREIWTYTRTRFHLALRPVIEGWFTRQTRITWEREYTFDHY